MSDGELRPGFTKHLKDNPGVRDCCKDCYNITVKEESPDLYVGTCGVCGAKHRRLMAANAIRRAAEKQG